MGAASIELSTGFDRKIECLQGKFLVIEAARRLVVALPVVATLLPVGSETVATAEDLPQGVEQLLPRGRIAAIVEPEFVPAAAARLPDDAWVLGVVVEDQAKAYSLNLLNRHEVVNDQSGGTAFAAVW